MDIEIPAELLLPTVEELEDRTADDLSSKWKQRKRPGKKERGILKKEKEIAKLKAIAEEFDNPKPILVNDLGSLFAPIPSKNFSLNDLNDVNICNTSKTLLPTLRVTLGELPPKPIVTSPPPARKTGRPPKVNAI
ncbi:MAG: hypothetical protein FWC26_11280 [Fibromonadales bacterium]|nr:hypothetical protein [Fibromonadales bacterium]